MTAPVEELTTKWPESIEKIMLLKNEKSQKTMFGKFKYGGIFLPLFVEFSRL